MSCLGNGNEAGWIVGWGSQFLWLSPQGFSHSDPGSLSMDLCPKAWEWPEGWWRLSGGGSVVGKGSLVRNWGKRCHKCLCHLYGAWVGVDFTHDASKLKSVCHQLLSHHLSNTCSVPGSCAGNGNRNLAQVKSIPYTVCKVLYFYFFTHFKRKWFLVWPHVLKIYNVLFPSH